MLKEQIEQTEKLLKKKVIPPELPIQPKTT
jgi:hypothetical protein